jgi:hypothetical protein
MSTEITPTPTDEEAAALVAAVDALWPRPVVAAAEQQRAREATWRFSGRWWAKPLPHRRDRPFR